MSERNREELPKSTENRLQELEKRVQELEYNSQGQFSDISAFEDAIKELNRKVKLFSQHKPEE